QSASRRSIANSSSLRNSPLPPIAASERSSTSSPRVLIGTSTTSRPGWASRRRCAACSLCHRASGLLRVAMRMVVMSSLSPGAGTGLGGPGKAFRSCPFLEGAWGSAFPSPGPLVPDPCLQKRLPSPAGTSREPLQLPDSLLQPRHAAAADFQRLLAVAQDRVHAAVGLAPHFDQFVAGDQAVAVDTQEAFAELLLQRLERFLDQVLAAGVVHDHVLFLGLQVVDVLDRDQAQAAAQARAQVGALAALAVAGGVRIAAGDEG